MNILIAYIIGLVSLFLGIGCCFKSATCAPKNNTKINSLLYTGVLLLGLGAFLMIAPLVIK